MRNYLSEFIGTYALLFVGTGAIIVNDTNENALTHPGVSLAFGLVIMAMIFAVGPISGAHFNPAVTVAFWVTGHFPAQQIAPYIASQLVGALLASLSLRLLLPTHATMGATIPTIGLGQAFILEIILTFFLMFVISQVALGTAAQGQLAAIAIGGTVAFCALFAGPLTGASMNPARSLAPALVAGQSTGQWIYLTAPFIGAVLAAFVWRAMQSESDSAQQA